MGDEVSGSESNISLSVTYLRAVLLAKMSERLHGLVYRRTLKKKPKKNKGKQRKAEDVTVKLIKVSAENLHFQIKKCSTVLEAMGTCKQITKSASTLGEMVLGRPERRDDNR